jgi:peptide/nickel transport system permease protein
MAASSVAEASRSGGRFVRLRKLRWPVRVASVVLVLAAVAAIFGPALAPESPNHVSLTGVFEPLFGAHLLGTDGSGRDILSRLLAGARSALLVPLGVCIGATAVGTLMGIGMAWRGGIPEAIASAGLDVAFAFPGLLAAILAVAIFGPGLLAPAIALAIVFVPYVARVVRAVALRERNLPYIAALKVRGFSTWEIVGRHLLPNIMPTVIAQTAVTYSYAIIDLAAINFLGLGLQAPASDWGLMVAEGKSGLLGGHAQVALSAAFCIVVVIISVNVIAEQFGGGAEARVG